MPWRLLLTGNPGTEDIITSEVLEYIRNAKVIMEKKGFGRVIVETDINDIDLISDVLLNMRSIHHGILLLAEKKVEKEKDALERIKDTIKMSTIKMFLTPFYAFAVRAERSGEGHEYTSLDVARIVGEAVIDTISKSYGQRPPVRLNSPSIVAYAEVIEDWFRFGILLTGDKSRHRRGYRIYDHPAALKPTLAYSMIRISETKDGDIVLDPMCGGGTIAIEAAMTFPSSEIICMDKNPLHIKGAKMNAIAARVQNRIKFLTGDARELPEILGKESVDSAISNPPYGIRLGDPSGVRRLYRSFLPALSRTLRNKGRATIITTESNYILELIRKGEVLRLKPVHMRKVRHGDLWASIIVLEKI